jgi:hypothetical protein
MIHGGADSEFGRHLQAIFIHVMRDYFEQQHETSWELSCCVPIV